MIDIIFHFTFFNAMMNSQRRNETEFGLKEQKWKKVFCFHCVILIKYLGEAVI